MIGIIRELIDEINISDIYNIMKLQENIRRIKQMMGIINENIDDVLDKMSRGEELSQEDKHKMSSFQKHLFSGKKENENEV